MGRRRRADRRRARRRARRSGSPAARRRRPARSSCRSRSRRRRSTTTSSAATTGPPASCTGPPRSLTCARPSSSTRRSACPTPARRSSATPTDIYVLRWAAHRGDLYRIPYGGQHEAGDAGDAGLDDRAGTVPRQRLRAGRARRGHRRVQGRQHPAAARRPDVAAHEHRRPRCSSPCSTPTSAPWRAAIDAGVTADWDPTASRRSQRHAASGRHVTAPPAPRRRVRSGRTSGRADPADDPLDPRWRGRPAARAARSGPRRGWVSADARRLPGDLSAA